MGIYDPLVPAALFHSADLVLITKVDLAAAVEFDRESAYDAINAVRPGLPILETSAKTGQGLEDWLALVLARQQATLASAPPQ